MAIKFDEAELQCVSIIKARRAGSPDTPVYNFPVSMKEGFKAAAKGSPIWELTNIETSYFSPRIIPDSIARAYVLDAEVPPPSTGGRDMFGIEWEYVPKAGGSMVRPGNALMDDANDWREKVCFPDIDSWDWDSLRTANTKFLDNGRFNLVFFMNGWFERLVSFMDFSGAAMALIDEEQTDAVKELLDAISELYIRIFDRLFTALPALDGVYAHDDWGAQRSPLFSPDTARELIAPAMRKFTDHIHSLGKFCEMHSCGKNEALVPVYIEAGWDSWCGQLINDTQKVYELYGDKILVGVAPDPLPDDADDEQKRQAARDFAARFCRKDKPSRVNAYSRLDPIFREELYRESRRLYM